MHLFLAWFTHFWTTSDSFVWARTLFVETFRNFDIRRYDWWLSFPTLIIFLRCSSSFHHFLVVGAILVWLWSISRLFGKWHSFEVALGEWGVSGLIAIRRLRIIHGTKRTKLVWPLSWHPLFAQILQHCLFLFFGLNDVFKRGKVFWLLEDMAHEDTDVLTVSTFVFF